MMPLCSVPNTKILYSFKEKAFVDSKLRMARMLKLVYKNVKRKKNRPVENLRVFFFFKSLLTTSTGK